MTVIAEAEEKRIFLEKSVCCQTFDSDPETVTGGLFQIKAAVKGVIGMVGIFVIRSVAGLCGRIHDQKRKQ